MSYFESSRAKPRFLDTTERGDFGGNDPFVDPDHTDFKCVGDTPCAAQIPRVEVCRQSKLGCVRQLHRVVFRVEAKTHRDWTNRFLVSQRRIEINVGQYGGLIERATRRMATTTTQNAGTFRHRICRVSFDFASAANRSIHERY